MGAPAAAKPPTGNRKTFQRTRVSLLERVASLITVVLLGVIGHAIWYQGRHFDPNRFALLDISRFVTYYEQDGLVQAREFYQALPASARDAAGVDLAALRDQCAFRIDYPEIVKRAQRNFA